MNEQRAILFAELLDEYVKDGYFVHQKAYESFCKAISVPNLEVGIVRRSPVNGKVEIFLAHRIDKLWKGWHIPGGKWLPPHTLEEGVGRIIETELGIMKIKVLAQSLYEKWMDHPSGEHPLSLLVICSPMTEVLESSTLKWFSQIPLGMIEDNGHHTCFIESIFKQVEEQKLV